MISDRAPLLLASASPRRREILETLKIPFVARSVHVDESVSGSETPEVYVRRVTKLKMEAAISEKFSASLTFAGVLAADTTVTIDGMILGKPSNPAEARSMIGRLAGRTHRVLTAYGLLNDSGERAHRVVETEVSLRAASDDELDAYVSTGEGLDKAGAYAIQGQGSFLVERISGSYPSVVGLPVCELVRDLKSLKLLRKYP